MKGSTYLIVILGIMVAKTLGFGRNIFFASAFGASELTDIYFQIFGIATNVFTGIGAALSTLVIKNMNKTEHQAPIAQRQYVSRFLCRIGLVVLGVTAVMYLLTGPIVRVLLPGLDGRYYADAERMMYIMLPSALFVIVAYIMSGVLQNCKVFFITSIMSLPYNVIILFALVMPGIDIYDICWITTLGWFLHIAILLPDFWRRGFRFFCRDQGRLDTRSEKLNLEVLYIFISSIMFQMCFVFDKAAVSHDSGAATTINYASNFFVTIASIFVVGISNVSFPYLSKNYEHGRTDVVRRTTQQLITMVFAVAIPFVLVALIFGTDIMSLMYERGKFTRALTEETAVLFVIYTLGILGYVSQELFNRVLYLGSRYRVTVIGNLLIIALKPLINLLVAPYGNVAIALSTMVLLNLYALLVFGAMTKVTGNYLTRELGVNLLKVLFSGAGALAVYGIYRFTGIELLSGKLSFLPPLALCGVAYLAIALFSGLGKALLPDRTEEE